MAKIRIIDTDVVPLCPHCSEPLTTIERANKGWVPMQWIYVCPHCKKLLSIAVP